MSKSICKRRLIVDSFGNCSIIPHNLENIFDLKCGEQKMQQVTKETKQTLTNANRNENLWSAVMLFIYANNQNQLSNGFET